MTEAGDRADEDSVWATECIDDLYQGAGLQWDGFSELLKTVFGLPFARLGDHVVDVLGGSWACFGGPARFAANAIMSSASLAGAYPVPPTASVDAVAGGPAESRTTTGVSPLSFQCRLL
jgi:hypothetical protein